MPEAHQKILIDADVLIHFFKGEQLNILTQIFPNEIIIIDKVHEEIRMPGLRNRINDFIREGFITNIEIDTCSNDIKTEYYRLIRDMGQGESSVMAYCRFNDDVLASSNLRDIKNYCITHGIEYLTTMDFLAEAYRKGILDDAECDYFIYNVKSKGSRLINHINTIQEYLDSL